MFPDRTLSTLEIVDKLRHIPEMKGVYSRNQIPRSLDVNKASAFVLNLDDSDGPGTHWVAVYHHPKSEYVDYFDSFGLPPPLEVQKYTKLKPIQYNDGMLQDLRSSACGYYCINFINFRSQGYSYQKIIHQFKEGEGVKNEKTLLKSLKGI